MANTSSTSICQECQVFLTGYWRLDPESESEYHRLDESGQRIGLRHHNLCQLEKCASNGCPMCVLILREVGRWNESEDLLRLRDAEFPGAEILLMSPGRQKSAPGPWKGDVSIRFKYMDGDSGESCWCFMRIAHAQSCQGMYTKSPQTRHLHVAL